MQSRALGETGLNVMPLVFGGNVFGWTIDQAKGFEVLDAFVDHGFNAIDTADCYSAWAPGNQGGESETIIGNWLKARPGMRERVVIFTKVGSVTGKAHPGGLTRNWIMPAVERSLTRLGIEAIDLYFSHWPDPDGTPYEETLAAFDALKTAGKIKAIGASNLDADQLGASLTAAKAANLPAYGVLQTQYNLYERSVFEGPLAELCQAQNIGVVTYYSLASGFLTGKYRSNDDLGKSARGGGMTKYLNPKGQAVLAALDEVAARHNAAQGEVALAWLMARPGVTAPIASATSVAQVESFARAAALTLSAEDMATLTAAGV